MDPHRLLKLLGFDSLVIWKLLQDLGNEMVWLALGYMMDDA